MERAQAMAQAEAQDMAKALAQAMLITLVEVNKPHRAVNKNRRLR